MRKLRYLALLVLGFSLGTVATAAISSAVHNITRVLVEYDDGSSAVFVPQATATPYPTFTSTSTPGWTPKPTITMLPTVTPVPSSPTPTPEVNETPMPTPGEAVCVLVVTTDVLNVRDVPWGNLLGQVVKNQYLRPEGKTTDTNGVVWYQIYWDEDHAGFVHSGYVTPLAGTDCSAFVSAAWLVHVIPGYNAWELQNSYPVLANADIGYGVKSYADTVACTQALDAGGECILRIPVHNLDCPERIGSANPVASAQDWMQNYQTMLGGMWGYKDTGRWYAELVNECYYGTASDAGVVYWWAEWINAAMDYATAHGWPPVVVPTFGPGSGDDTFLWTAWKSAMLKVQAAGGLVGFHAYTPYGPDGLCQCDEWQACRHRRNYAAMQASGLDLGYSITEAAAGWGNNPVDEADFVCWYKQVEHDPGLQSVAAWLGGYSGTWPNANLDGHYQSLALAIAQ